MVLVKTVSGPASASVGDVVTYRITAFTTAAPAPADVAAVRWLVKTEDGAALAHLTDHGPELQLAVPATWAGQVAIVMPYMRSPSTAVAVTTRVGAGSPMAAGPAGSRTVSITRDGARFYASVDAEPRFYLGSDVRYQSRRGLMNTTNPPGPRYRAEDFEAVHGDWAWYLLPTITCESARAFTCLNTYDRACLTFGHIQLAAHTPNDNFVKFFREALAQPPATFYFPDLTVAGGRVQEVTGAGLQPLESDTSTAAFMAYFNATPDRVDDQEADRAARLVHWCTSHAAMRELQVAFAIQEQQHKLASYARSLPLDGRVDKLCLVVMDILHQGRAKFPAIRTALAAADPFDALLGLGASSFGERVGTLRAGIRDLETRGIVGRKVYDAGTQDFVVPPGA